jgi:hypothetical protein
VGCMFYVGSPGVLLLKRLVIDAHIYHIVSTVCTYIADCFPAGKLISDYYFKGFNTAPPPQKMNNVVDQTSSKTLPPCSNVRNDRAPQSLQGCKFDRGQPKAAFLLSGSRIVVETAAVAVKIDSWGEMMETLVKGWTWIDLFSG